MDLDNFRDINERYGHETGDRSIVEVVRIVNGVMRESDILARFGGDEFVMLLPDTAGETAQAMAERIRLDVESKGILKGYGGRESGLTLSVGIASFPEDGDDVKKLKEAADRALYRAKENGRNRVVRTGS